MAKRSKKQEKRKKKMRTLILLLFLTIIMLGTSTYAWFTANKVVTINALNVQVQTAGGIQISTNAKDWKSVITRSDITTGYSYNSGAIASVNQLPEEVTAVSSNCVYNTAEGAEKGRINMFSSVITNNATTGKYDITTVKETDANGTSGKYIAFDVFLRLDSQSTVYMTPESNVTVVGNEDRGLKNAARVAFIQLGQGLSSTATETIAGWNNPSSIKVWEPNYDTHSQVVINSVAPEYGVTLTQTDGVYNPVSYAGVSAVTGPQDLVATVKADPIQTGTQAVGVNFRTKATNTDYVTFYENMPAGVTKYRIYMWVEGQDIDCENNATGSEISYKVVLSTTNNPAEVNGGAASSSSNG